ncbi:ATPase [Echinicola pacifica]|uniref:ATPase n=1 Tax=Echinicola pacifica TaxID=346377 RepID=A0A918PMC5_9BACT|nr:heavy metal translocating P-type ATPase metal-binding domain-containing protein [Echinicola pacifica]GGZ14737.1 ATPase [Echinicola pacifica]
MTKIKEKSIALCFHCGESCATDFLLHDQKHFCCTGCKLVYEVLQDNDLMSYYEYANQPGTRKSDQHDSNAKFDYLEEPEVIQKLVSFQNEEEMHVVFEVPAIHCVSCIWLLEHLSSLQSGIRSSRVNFVKKECKIKFSPSTISLKEVVQLLSKIGYEPHLKLSALSDRKTKRVTNPLIVKIAVAGFCFGNMMFFSLPEYFNEAALLGDSFSNLFSYLNFALAIPVLFFSGNDYFISAWTAIKRFQINMDVPIALGMVALFSYSFYMLLVGGLGYFDSLGGLVFFLLIGKYYQQKTFDNLSFDRDYKSYFPLSVVRISAQGNEEVISLPKIKVGDLIVVKNAELIPADAILLEGEAWIDYSFVTGEEEPVRVKCGETIYAGGRQTGAVIQLKVEKEPSQGYLTDLWNDSSFAESTKEQKINLTNQISGWFTFAILLIASISLIYWWSYDISVAIQVFTSVLIVACPCALALSAPFTLGNTLRVFGANRFYLKNGQVIEDLAGIDAYIFDKTGTLTDPQESEVLYVGSELSEEELQVIKSMVRESAHPLSRRLDRKLSIDPVALNETKETAGKGLEAHYNNQNFRLGSSSWVSARRLIDHPEVGSRVYISINGEVRGYYTFSNNLRQGVAELVSGVKADGSVHILSGDHGSERGMLEQFFGKDLEMNFNQSPKDKLEYIRQLNESGSHTLMLGDGLNDAGALYESRVGIAICETSTNFSPASDAILDSSAIDKLPAFLRMAKDSKRIIMLSFALSFLYNVVGLSLAVQGMVSPVFCAILMPLSSISVVIFTSLMVKVKASQRGLNPNWLWK